MAKPKLTPKQRADIERNKRLGLLCACNQVRVPYFGTDGKEQHGTRLVNGILHGYMDCARQ